MSAQAAYNGGTKLSRTEEGRGLPRPESADGGPDTDARWYPVYAAVVVTTALVIAALWAFSRAYSS